MINKHLPYGATALNSDDLKGLIPDYINNRNDLNEYEKQNINEAMQWLTKIKPSFEQILDIDFCLELHKKMFNKTWQWAGTYRTYLVNIGNTPHYLISTHLKNVLDNALYWIEHNTYSINELCLRVHRDIVWIHPFPNGNGRFSRIISDELRHSLGFGYFSWGSAEKLTRSTDTRKTYIIALRAADEGNYQPLLDFAI